MGVISIIGVILKAAELAKLIKKVFTDHLIPTSFRARNLIVMTGERRSDPSASRRAQRQTSMVPMH